MLNVVVDRHEYFTAFSGLNYEWITELFGVEASDRKVLDDPGQLILQGGHILTLLKDQSPIGCCALLANGPERFELAKMAIAPEHRGHGHSHHLMRAAIQTARHRGASRIDLLTSSKLKGAIALYEQYGFERVGGCHADYARCDVVMALEL